MHLKSSQAELFKTRSIRQQSTGAGECSRISSPTLKGIRSIFRPALVPVEEKQKLFSLALMKSTRQTSRVTLQCSSCTFPRHSIMAEPHRFNIAVIGLGAISKYWLLAIRKHARVRLVAACDVRAPMDPAAVQNTPLFNDYHKCAIHWLPPLRLGQNAESPRD